MSSASSSVTSAPVRLTGRVKWFNNKTGFGFISVVGGNDQFKDASEIFVHHSAVTVSQEQYRYLVEGEYVEFSVVVTESGAHKFQAGDVRGVKGGKLFCETRREHRVAQEGASGSREHRNQHQHQNQQRHQDGESSHGSGATRGGRVTRGRGGYSRNGESGGEWMLVRRGHTGDRQPYRPRQQRPERPERTERPERHTQKHEQEHPASANTSTQPPAPVETPALATTGSSDVQSTPRTASSKKPRQTKPTF